MPVVLGSVADAAAIVDRGGVVVVPTETVYGLAAKPQADTVARIFAIKGRSSEKVVQLLIPDVSWLERFANPTPGARALAQAFWPGPLTLVMEAGADAPPSLVADGAIGLRVPSHPVALELLALTGPLAASSANPSGEPTASTVGEIASAFGDAVDGYLDGGRMEGSGSTVMRFSATVPEMLREGPISQAEIARVLAGGSGGVSEPASGPPDR